MRLIESEVLPGAAAPAQAEPWLQFGLTPRPGRAGELRTALAEVARTALRDGQAQDFFYMNKPPGMRVRFRTDGGSAAVLGPLLRERLRAWRHDGLISDWRPGVYEPETYLFGGPASMRSVHRVFTADSLAWLGFHGRSPAIRPDRAPGPGWAMSLLLLQALFSTLRIVGWEDLDVWERVRRYRPLGPAVAADPRLGRLATALRAVWPSPAALAGRLSPEAADLADDYRRAVNDEGDRWFRDYFESGSATMGPRAVASYLVLFHWNRAGLAAWRQGLIAEALLVREADDAR